MTYRETIVLLRPKEREWIVVNTVFVRDGKRNEIYGYLIRNKELEQRIVKEETLKALMGKGRLERSGIQELADISVPRDYEEETKGLNL